MGPTSKASERQREAAVKAWETIRRKQGEKTRGESSERSDLAEAKETIRKIRETIGAKEARVSRKDAYPTIWKQIVANIHERARNADGLEQCECSGECMKHRGRCEEINRTWAKHRRRKGKVKIRLTTAHLCHTPKCEDESHLRAMCEPCHLIYDLRCRQRGLRGGDAIMWAAQQRSDEREGPNDR
jgi:hypothetical protein